jgi:hypothetical protein
MAVFGGTTAVAVGFAGGAILREDAGGDCGAFGPITISAAARATPAITRLATRIARALPKCKTTDGVAAADWLASARVAGSFEPARVAPQEVQIFWLPDSRAPHRVQNALIVSLP